MPAGFDLGFERILAYVTGLAKVRDAIPFPRTPGKRAVLIRTTGGRELINGRRSRHRDFAGFGSLSAS